MKTLMFPGQGSQAKGMGGTLFEEFGEYTAKADAILGYSIRELCLEDPRNQLDRTEFTQPALYVVSALSCVKKLAGSAAQPDFLAGHSLGEFNALLAAGAIDFETGLRIVQKRGELMGRIANGAMAAVLNATKEEIEAVLAQNGLTGIDLANYNTPSQIVISGSADEMAAAAPLFQQGKMLFYPLNTSGAFHSRCMSGAKEQFSAFLETISFCAPKIPVIANVTARPYRAGAMLENITTQMTSTVRWSESVQYLLALGQARGATMECEEVGHGDVLTRLFQTIRRQTPIEVLGGLATQIAAEESAAANATATAAAVVPAPRAQPATAIEKVAAWNSRHSVGTRVRSAIAEYAGLETRTPAIVLFGHRAAVYMKGYNGYFDLDEIVAVA